MKYYNDSYKKKEEEISELNNKIKSQSNSEKELKEKESKMKKQIIKEKDRYFSDFMKKNTYIIDDYDEVYDTQPENCIAIAPFNFIAST